MRDNFDTTFNLYKASLEPKRLKCIVTFGSAEEYGKMLSQIKDKQRKQKLMFGNWEYSDISSLIEYDAILDLFQQDALDEEETAENENPPSEA